MSKNVDIRLPSAEVVESSIGDTALTFYKVTSAEPFTVAISYRDGSQESTTSDTACGAHYKMFNLHRNSTAIVYGSEA